MSALTDQDWIDLGKRAVASPHWSWRGGMLARKCPSVAGTDHPCDIVRVVDTDNGTLDTTMWASMEGDCWLSSAEQPYWIPGLAIPDLRDPCTVGGLLSLVREAHNKLITISSGAGWYEVEHDRGHMDGADGFPFVAALVAALEAAPSKGRDDG